MKSCTYEKEKNSEISFFSAKTGSDSKKHVPEKITMDHPTTQHDIDAAVVSPVTQDFIRVKDENPPESSVSIPASDCDVTANSKKVRFLAEDVDGATDGSVLKSIRSSPEPKKVVGVDLSA